jgi:valyl-tRNA synthetase
MENKQTYDYKEVESKLLKFWDSKGIYKFDPKSKSKIFSIDTPPPTVSGKMHIGHAFSYSQQDFVARYHRMKGENVFYPFGTDDNGLPTERLVEKLKGVKSTHMSRTEFVQLCEKTIKEIKPDFINDWKIIGMSCDFSNTYSTIDEHCIKTSQKSFIDLFKKKLVYQNEAPSMWCVQCQTAIAQADLEDKELDSTFNDIKFNLEDGSEITISTTRPELLPACVCIHVHPADKRYKKLVGKNAVVPLFNQKVKIFTDEAVDPEKGSGILMICSYGDKFDVEAINKRKITPRIAITKDGKMNELAGEFAKLPLKEARKEILKKLEEKGFLLSKRPIRHSVNVHERCGTEIEFLTTRQWFIKILDNKKKFLDAGKKINWYPEFMRMRYEKWIEGLNWDWCISRQRHFGISFPVWKCNKCSEIIVADEKDLPVDPLITKPKNKCKCGSNDFSGELDVMDTWATSSVSPQIITNWAEDNVFKVDFSKMYPCSLRPQAHDIIRTWAFYTIVKGIYHNNKQPWDDIIISGHVLDPKGQAMHKSKGNVVEPATVLAKYPADALRFWSSSSKLGDDLRYLEKDLETGQRTITKLFNASKFVFQSFENYETKKPKKLEAIDEWLLIKLNELVKICTEAFDNYEYFKAKSAVENFFWHVFCDNYLEIVKDRLYNPDRRGQEAKESGQYVLYAALLTIVKLFAPIMPFITEELYQNYFKKDEKAESIHISSWPKFDKTLGDKKLELAGDKFLEVLTEVRKEKSKSGKSLKTEIITLTCYPEVKIFEQDLMAVSHAKTLKYGKELKIEF